MTQRSVAVSHYNRSITRLRKKSLELQNLYHTTFSGHISRGELIEISEDIEPLENYLTSVLVFKPGHPSTPLRICWNLSLRNKFGKCINSAVLTGINLIKNLVTHLMFLREHKYLLMADITKAFLRIKYLPQYTKFFKLLYARDFDSKPKTYKFTSVLFGLTSSPYILNRTLRFHIEKVMAENPKFTHDCIKLFSAFYLDDLGCSFGSIQEAKNFVKNSMEILELGDFTLTKWIASHPSILEDLDSTLIHPATNQGYVDMRNATSYE